MALDLVQRAAMTRRAFRALAPPIFVVGLEWLVSGTNKLIGNFVGTFPAYVSGLQAEHTFLPGLSLMAKAPILAAWLAIVTENVLGITLLLASVALLFRAKRIWEVVAGTALVVSTFVAAGLWLIVGRPPFWPDGVGYGSGWPIEFFLLCISAALTVAIAFADPDETLVMRATRFLHHRK